MLGWLMASAWSKKRRKFTDFLPPWYDIKAAKPVDPDDAARRLFEHLTQMAENGGSPSRQ